MLAPSALLAAGGDVSRHTAGLAPLTRAGVPHSNPHSYTAHTANGEKLYRQSEVRGHTPGLRARFYI